MKDQQLTRASITALFIAMLIGSVLVALFATFLPPYVGLDDETTMMVRIVLYGAAALGAGQAFWLKAKLTRQLPPQERTPVDRKTGSTVQRQ